MKSLYLALDKDGKQLGLYTSPEAAWQDREDANTCEIWDLVEKTGRFAPTNASVGRLTLLPKKGS